jgi:hypothetical protein
MLKAEIKIGGTYLAKISGRISIVRIDESYVDYRGKNRGWNATNLRTNREIRIKSAAKLRREVTP